MRLTSRSFDEGGPIPPRHALARADPERHSTFADNVSPHLAWSEVPPGTRSFALLCVDLDAPTVPDDVNQEGRAVPADLPRAAFHHWVMVDLAPELRELAEGECGRGVVPGGKQEPPGPPGVRQGVQDYTGWFAGDPAMAGTYRGYDGPGPPWNDERVHRYRFRLLALDLRRLPVEGDFTAADVEAAVRGHVLAEATLTGTYTQNPELLEG